MCVCVCVLCVCVCVCVCVCERVYGYSLCMRASVCDSYMYVMHDRVLILANKRLQLALHCNYCIVQRNLFNQKECV